MPAITIILATSRPSLGAMLAWPEVDHLAYTLGHLAAQTFGDFEVIVADCLRGTSLRAPVDAHGLAVYHVPVESAWLTEGLPAISAARNAGIAHAAGDFVVFLDDCCALRPDALGRWHSWYARHRFASALHRRMRGEVEEGRDARFALFDGSRQFTFTFGGCGYQSAGIEACLRVNGFDEAFDGSRQLEDGDFADRLRGAGYTLVLDRSLIVEEQIHGAPHARDGAVCRNATRCNGPWYTFRAGRPGEFRANDRDWTDEERRLASPCSFLRGTICSLANVDCNMWAGDVAGGRHLHAHLDVRLLTAPVFDLAERRRRALADRERFRIG